MKDPWVAVSEALRAVHPDTSPPPFVETVGYIGVLPSWSMFKQRPRNTSNVARYLFFKHRGQDRHLLIQFLASGILSVVYDRTRSSLYRPGFTAFEPGRGADDTLELPVLG